ncbi:MAG: alpha/beta hydrolase-fold protein [Nitrososphaerales archaeon]
MAHPLLQQAQTSGTPIIDGGRATFLWQGDPPPYLVGDFNDWDADHAAHWSQVEEDLWSFSLEFPPDAYIEYALLLEPREDSRTPDSFNDRTAPNGLGHINHYFYMPQGRPTPLIGRAPGVPQGKLSRHRIDNDCLLADGKRWVHLYRPPVDHPVPLVVVYDAQDYLTRGRITQIVDNLIAQGRIQPIALALADNGKAARGIEYSCNEATITFVMTEILPLAQKRLNLVDHHQQPGAHAVLGASMAGLMAMYTGLRVPQVFGHVLSQSGAFEMGQGVQTVVSQLVRYMPRQPLKIWMDVGRYEWLLEPNRQMHALLQERGYDVTYHEYNAGHNYPAWRDDLWRGLEVAYGRHFR